MDLAVANQQGVGGQLDEWRRLPNQVSRVATDVLPHDLEGVPEAGLNAFQEGVKEGANARQTGDGLVFQEDGLQPQAPCASSQPITAIGEPSGLMKVKGPRKVM